MTEGGNEIPWWENNVVVIFVIIGLPIVGLISNGVLSLIGFNRSEFPTMFSTDFFMTDLFIKLLTLPIGVFLLRALLRRVHIE
ncbi:MAG: hypothetical protein VX057_03670 [Candidatus Thermoplasmatota archaeon]|nr:hypothetical protein [Candidatus Thermoplasmatota archaeon]